MNDDNEFLRRFMKGRYNAEYQNGYQGSFENWSVENEIKAKETQEAESEKLRLTNSPENQIFLAHRHDNPLLPTNWSLKTFDYFTANEEKLKKIVDILKKQDLADAGFWLSGSVGCGKTHVLLAAFNVISGKFYNKYSMLNGEIKYYNYSDLCSILRQDPNDFDKFKKIRSPRYLFIDDIGVSKNSDFIQEKIYSIFNYRVEQGLPTFVSTNLNLKEIQQEFNDRMISRIKESSAWIELTGIKDYRSNFIQNNMQRFKDL